MKFGKTVHRLTYCFKDGGHDVISRRKVLSSGECTLSICQVHVQQRPAVPDPYNIQTCLFTTLFSLTIIHSVDSTIMLAYYVLIIHLTPSLARPKPAHRKFLSCWLYSLRCQLLSIDTVLPAACQQ